MSLPHFLSVVALLSYGALVLIGGIEGYRKASSLASLLAGSISAGVLWIAAAGMAWSKNWGIYVALIALFLLVALFSYRWMKTRALWPSGLLGILGLLIGALLVSVYLFLKNRYE
jgi:uncharacterized membrane protein (UPF0136 family)